MVGDKVRKNVNIREDQEQWLQEHPGINLSGFLQKKLDELMETYD